MEKMFNKDIIRDDEVLYRAVKKSYPDAFDNGEPMPALFIDGKGASVERDGGRTDNEIVNIFKEKFKNTGSYNASVKISAGKCREIGTYPNPIGNHTNIFHAEIHESETVKEISLKKAVQLALMCIIVKE